jgi:hypothetical protein
MTEREPKLTGEAAKLYAEIRSRVVMPEMGEIKPKLPERTAESSKAKKERSSHEERRSLLPPERMESLRRKPESGGIFESLPNASELTLQALDSHKERDQIFGVMAAELEGHTQLQPIKEWTDRQRALEYDEWEDLSKQLKKEKEKDSRHNRMLSTVTGIKELLVEGLPRERKARIIEKDARHELLEQPRRQIVDANKIKTEELQREFKGLIERVESGERAKPAELADLRKAWHDLELRYEGKLGNDKQGARALEKARTHISSLNKSIIASREQMPQVRKPITHARAESTRPSEESRQGELRYDSGGVPIDEEACRGKNNGADPKLPGGRFY